MKTRSGVFVASQTPSKIPPRLLAIPKTAHKTPLRLLAIPKTARKTSLRLLATLFFTPS